MRENTAQDTAPDRRRELRSLLAGFQCPDAFNLYHYRCRTGHTHRIWNSRDGVVPFVIGCPTCGEEAKHEDWHLDRFDPFHRVAIGEPFFRDLRPEEARAAAERRVERDWNHPEFPLSAAAPGLVHAAGDLPEDELKAATVEHFARQYLADWGGHPPHLASADDAEFAELNEQWLQRASMSLMQRLDRAGYHGKPVPSSRTVSAEPSPRRAPAPAPAPSAEPETSTIVHEEGTRFLVIELPPGTRQGRLRVDAWNDAARVASFTLRWEDTRVSHFQLDHPKRGAPAPIRIGIEEAFATLTGPVAGDDGSEKLEDLQEMLARLRYRNVVLRISEPGG